MKRSTSAKKSGLAGTPSPDFASGGSSARTRFDLDVNEVLPALPRARDAAFEMISGGLRFNVGRDCGTYEVFPDRLGPIGRGDGGVGKLGLLVRRCAWSRPENPSRRFEYELDAPGHIVPARETEFDDPLVVMLDDAIRSTKRTAAAMDRLSGTLQELQEWAAARIDAAHGEVVRG